MTPPRFRLLQARDPGELTRAEEHAAFADKLQVPPDHIVQHDLLSEPNTLHTVRDGVDAVLVGGSGRYGINDDAPWLPSFVDLLGELVAVDAPTFASCFGFQAIVVALGGKVESVSTSAEVGSYPLGLTDEGRRDPVFGELPEPFWAQMGHKDSATELPPSVTLLAHSERCAHQALKTGRNVYATQFHPELSRDDNQLRFERYLEAYTEAFGADEARAILDRFQPSEPSSALLRRFVRHVVG